MAKVFGIVLFCVLTLWAGLGENTAQASRARLLVMGTGDAGSILGTSGNRGSFFYDDAYNMFYNPAVVTQFGNWVIVEKSNFAGSVGRTAQGGFVTELGKFHVGAYLNRLGALPAGYTNLANFRPIDLVIGADHGVKWGFGLTYGSFRTGADGDADLTLRGGVIVKSIELFAAAKVLGDEKTLTPDAEYREFSGGARWLLDGWVPFAAMSFTRRNSVHSDAFGAGIGRNVVLPGDFKLNAATGVWRRSSARRNIIPIELGMEKQALEWLSLRGGIAFRLWDQVDGVTQSDSTTGRLGAAFHIGKQLDLEWAIGRTGSALETGPGFSIDYDSQNFDVSTGFFTAANLSYRW